MKIKNYKKILFLSFISFCVIYILILIKKYSLNHSVIVLKTHEDISNLTKIDKISLSYGKRKWTILSVNLDEINKLFYLFYLPFTSLAWKRVDYEPFLLLISSDFNNLNQLAITTINYLNKFKINYIQIQSIPNYELLTAMISRNFIGVLNDDLIDDNDYIITSDADLIPINKEYYYLPKKINSIRVLNAFCCGEFIFKNQSYRMYPMGHIGMKKIQWREMMHLDKGVVLNSQLIITKIQDFFGNSHVKINKDIKRGDSVWYVDQKMVSINLYNYVNRTNTYLDLSPYIGDRMNSFDKKIKDNIAYNYDKFTDFHSFHSDYNEKIDLFKLLSEKLFQNDTHNLLCNYFDEFILKLKKKWY